MYDKSFCAFSLARLPPFSVLEFSPISVYLRSRSASYIYSIDYSLPIAPQDVLNSCPSFEFIFCLQFALKFTVTYIFYCVARISASNKVCFRTVCGTVAWIGGWIA